MGQSNPNKVNAIVEEIVKNNSIFKLKSPIEQDKEKDSMVKSINSALSVLNEVGKDLVLKDLSVDPDEKFKGFIDSAGNIDISGLTQFTTTIVKGTIEEAEREGLNLRRDAPSVFRNNKISVIEGVLTVAVIDSMIKDFDKLSADDKNSLAENWGNMSNKQKKDYSTALGNSLTKKADTVQSPTTKKRLQDLGESLKNIVDIGNQTREQITNMSEREINEIFKTLYPNSQESNTKAQRKKLLEDYSKSENQFIKSSQSCESARTKQDIVKKTDEAAKIRNRMLFIQLSFNLNPKIMSLETFENQSLDRQDLILAFINNHLIDTISLDEFLNLPSEQISKYLPDYDLQQYEQKELNLETHLEKENKISQEIEQLPSALAKTGFTEKQIKETLSQYINTFKTLNEEDINEIATLSDEDLQETLQEIFIEDGMNENIAKILSSINYNGKFQQILTNQETREQFLQQFDQVIEQKIVVEQDVKLTGELETLFAEYFEQNAVDMKVSAIETQQEHITEKKQTATQEQQPEAEQADFSKVVASGLGSEEHVPPEESGKVDDMEQENSELHNQNTALVQQDNSFIGKIRRVVANMRDNKNKSNKGFFGRLKDSIQSEFGNKKYSQYFSQEDTEQQSNSPIETDTVQQNSQQQQVNDVFQRVSVNPLEAVRKTAESNTKKSLETDDKAPKDEGEREN